MRHLIVILLLLPFETAHAAGKTAAPDFSSYPQTESFRHYLSVHTNALWQHLGVRTNAAWPLPRTNLVAISAFPSGGSYALEYFVIEGGQEYDRRNAYGWAIQASRGRQLSEADLTSLRRALRELPAESVSPPIERLVIVSFQTGTNWVTRSYDSATLPQPMRQIYGIIGERYESKKAK